MINDEPNFLAQFRFPDLPHAGNSRSDSAVTSSEEIGRKLEAHASTSGNHGAPVYPQSALERWKISGLINTALLSDGRIMHRK